MIEGLAAAIRERGFAIIERHDPALPETLALHAASLAAGGPAHASRSAPGSNSRLHLVDHAPGLERLYLDPLLIGLASDFLRGPVRLSAFLSRTVHPGAAAQPLHADCPWHDGAPALFGFIYALDDFRADNGATRFGDAEIPAIAPAGSLIVYDSAMLHGFAANNSANDRRSIQGSFAPRANPAGAPLPRQPRGDLARFLTGDPAHASEPVSLDRLRPAVEAGWDERTAYQGATRPGNPAFGQCYPTARVVQWFDPALEIACGDVVTGAGAECHFWNVRAGDPPEHIDLSWQQFPPGSRVERFELLDRTMLGDSPPTTARCGLLLQRALTQLSQNRLP
jgi:hypothetical protein